MQLQLHTKRGLPNGCRKVSQTSPDTLQPQKVWHKETTAPGLITANMTTTAITKPDATTAACKVTSHSGADKPQLQKVWHQTATNAAGLITTNIATTAVMKPHATAAAYEAYFTEWFTGTVANNCREATTEAYITTKAVMKLHATTAAYNA